MPSSAAFDDLTQLLPDWARHLRSRNLSVKTQGVYTQAGERLIEWLQAEGLPTDARSVTRSVLVDYFNAMRDRENRIRPDRGISAATVGQHFASLRVWFRWMADAEEAIIPASPMAKMIKPIVPEQDVPVIPDDDIAKILTGCTGTKFRERRDTALIRVLFDTGARIAEVAALGVEDLDWTQDTMDVLGKGRRRREIPFGNKTGEALRRYLRVRREHPYASVDALWVGRSGPLTIDGCRQIVKRRGEQVGVTIHPHQFRHTMAHNWLNSGGTEGALMRQAGWRSREMLNRYGASVADARSRLENRRLGLGDRL